MKKKKFTPSTLQDRIDVLRQVIRGVIDSHGAPCGCVLCETLLFDSMAADGEINIITGERK